MLWIVWWSVILSFMLSGCTRSLPPEIGEFKPPPEPVVAETTEPEFVADTSVPEAPKAEPEPEEKEPPAAKPAPVAEAPPPKEEPKKEAPKAPSIVGTWRVTEMSHNGQSMPMEAEMIFTFAEDGSLTMSVSHPQMPEAMTRQGSYTLSDGQLSITMENETKTGTLTFDGDNRATLDIEGGKMVLTRT